MSGLQRAQIAFTAVLGIVLTLSMITSTHLALSASGSVAQAVTATPEFVIQPTPTYPPIGLPLLELSQSLGQSTALPGQQLSMSLNISSIKGGSITLKTLIQGSAQIISAATAAGQCSDASCSITLGAGQSQAINLMLQINPNAGSTTIIVQSLAQDQWYSTAASEKSYIVVSAPPTAMPALVNPAPTSQIAARPPLSAEQLNSLSQSSNPPQPNPAELQAAPAAEQPPIQRGIGQPEPAPEIQIANPGPELQPSPVPAPHIQVAAPAPEEQASPEPAPEAEMPTAAPGQRNRRQP